MAPSFLDYPPEIREQIYSDILSPASSRLPPSQPDEPGSYNFHLAILRTNRQIYHEALKIFQDNIFIKITTPWPEAIRHIRSEGKVASVTTGEKANGFHAFHLWVFIDTPGTPSSYPQEHFSMIVSLDDLPAFTNMWHHSNLNHPGLNAHLRLNLTMQDPHVPERKIPKQLQSALLLPFGRIKELHAFSIQGSKLLPSVSAALEAERAIPDPTPEDCLKTGFALKDAGNEMLKAGCYTAALQKYIDAFEAIHIHVEGRTRTIHCDHFYIRELTSGPHKGMRGHYARMILRVQLVANIVLVYLKLENYTEAHFWGKRSVVLFRQSVTGDENEELLSEHDDASWLYHTWDMRFPGHDAMGRIFYRTALASRALGKTADVKTLMKAAAVYLPRDEIVQKEVKALDGRA